MRFREFKIKLNEAVDKDVMSLQRELKAAGANLGNFGPANDGIDGRLGPYTRRAADKFPDIANKYKEVLTRPDSVDAQKIDVTTIQDPDFKQKLEKVAGALGVKSSDLMAIFKQESGVNPAAVNSTSGATGLIQFMPATASKLGTSVEELRKMDGVQQLDYVYKYFKMTGVGDGTLGDLYMAVFMPKYVGYPDHTVLGQRGADGFSGKVFAQNSGLDRNKDGAITVADVKNSVARFA
jgi:AraC-like DNA-binding protein